ncbi:MAG TPA: type III secretion system export apparatus subunit SctS [Albitalea sp.]|uniref:type III secretion system export apparatus subunit SctS n=1 Tax=Piscinibacter sp. TaxID=1903157 RepID=UPI002ED28853
MESVDLLRNALVLIMMLSAPALIVATLIGILVSLVQSLFQIQDQTLSFALKLVAITAVLFATGRWMQVEMITLTETAFELMGQVR